MVVRAIFFSLVVAASSPVAPQEGLYQPGTFQLTPEIDLDLQPVPVRVPRQFAHLVPRDFTLNLPPGFSVGVFAAEGLRGPRFMAFSPEGVLHVADMGRGQIIAFPDRDQDGVADEGITVAQGLVEGHSLAFYRDALYITEEHQVSRLFDRDGDGIYADDREVFIADIPWEGGHDTRTIVFDEINDKLYLSVGSPCDLCRQEPGLQLDYTREPAVPYSPERGSILQFNADGTGRRIFATGVRNVIGMDMHPVTNELWGNNNHFDFAGPHLPPEWIDIIRDGGFYGLPFAYGYQVYIDFTIPEYQKILPLTREDSLQVSGMRRPVALVPAHLAPMAIHFYRYDTFPPQYRHAAFIALRGGQVEGNLAVVPGFKVVALFSDPDGAKARVGDFLTGFGTGPKRDDVLGKPVGLTTDGAGRLYVTSDTRTFVVLRIEHSDITGSWEHSLPGEVANGARLSFGATVHLEHFDPQGPPPRVSVDLSGLGGPSSLPLEAVDERTYRLDTTLQVEAPIGGGLVQIRIEQGEDMTHLVQRISVLPGGDRTVLEGAVKEDWNLVLNSSIVLDREAETQTYQGRAISPFLAQPRGLATWKVEFVADQPVSPEGYRALRFAFHPGDAQLPERNSRFFLSTEDPTSRGKTRSVDLLDSEQGFGVDLSRRTWQVVEVSLDALDLPGEIESFRFSGSLVGSFFLDDIRLVARDSPPPQTAVVEEFEDILPSDLALGQNYPNPFRIVDFTTFPCSRG